MRVSQDTAADGEFACSVIGTDVLTAGGAWVETWGIDAFPNELGPRIEGTSFSRLWCRRTWARRFRNATSAT